MKLFRKYIAICAALLGFIFVGFFSAVPQQPLGAADGAARQAAAKPQGYTPDPANFAVDEETGVEYVKHIVIVHFEPTASAKQKKAACEAVGGRVVGSIDILYKWELEVLGERLEDIRRHSEFLRGMPGVAHACPDRVARVALQGWPNDPWSPDPSKPDKSNRWWAGAIHLPEAWEYNEIVTARVDLGMIDGGAAPHPELNGILENLVPVNAARGLAHGTGVAGLMAARANNGIGVAGVCWNARVYAVDFHTTGGSTSQIMNSVARVVQRGAEVVNISLGWIGSGRYPNGITEQAHQDDEAALAAVTMSQLMYGGYDFLVAQSAGNRPVDAIQNGMFCSVTAQPNNTGLSNARAKQIYDRILVVGAARRGGGITGYSARGRQVSLYAPGGEAGSPARQIFTPSGDDGYQYTQGTSFAAPLVAATAGWMLAANPGLDAGQVGRLLKRPEISPIAHNIKTLDTRRAMDQAYPAPFLKANDDSTLKIAGSSILGMPPNTKASDAEAILNDNLKAFGGELNYPRAGQFPEQFAKTGDLVSVERPIGNGVNYTLVVAASN